MHKQAMKRLSDEIQKVKHTKDNLPEVNKLTINQVFLVCVCVCVIYFFVVI